MVSSTTTDLANLGNTAFGGGGQKFAAISAAADASREIVAAVKTLDGSDVLNSSKIRVLALYMTQVGHSSATFKWLSDTTVITGVSTPQNLDLVLVLPFNPAGWFETAAGEALELHPVQTPVFGALVYEEVAGT